MGYWLSLIIFTAIFTIGALSYSLLLGHAGVFSVAHSAFIGIGGYATGILTVQTGLSPVVGLVAGVIVATVIGWVFAIATLRVSGDYMVVASFALLVIFIQVANNWTGLTGGGTGIPAIPRPLEISSLPRDMTFAVIAVLAAGIVYVVTHAVVESPLGLSLRAMREDPDAALSLGKSVRRYRSTIFALSSGLAAVAGSVYAHYVSYINPADFTIHLTIVLLTVVIIAGTGRLWTVPVAAVLVVGATEALGYLELPTSIQAGAEQALFGVLFVVFALVRPEGLISERSSDHG